MNSNCSYTPETPNLAPNQSLFILCNLEIWQMILKRNRAPLLTYFKLYASFHSHWCIQTGVTVWKHPIWVKLGDLLSPVTLKFDKWPWKSIGHLFHTTSSYAHNSVAICKFKLELWSGKSQVGAKFSLISVTLTFDLWPRPFACTSRLSMVITPENFRKIWLQEHCEKGVTVGQTDGRID